MYGATDILLWSPVEERAKMRPPTLNPAPDRKGLMRNPSSALFALLVALAMFPANAATSAAASDDPVMDFILAADAIQSAGGSESLIAWLPEQPDLTGAAVASLIDIGVQVGDAGSTEDEAGNIVLVEALAAAHAAMDADSFMPTLLAEYRAWTPQLRNERAAARARDDEGWELISTEPSRSLEIFAECEVVYERIADSHSLARLHGRMGAAHWYLGNADALIASYEEALRRRRLVQDRKLEAATLNGLGSANYQVLGDMQAAADWYTQAVALRRSIGDLAGLATSLTYLANTRLELGDPVTARGLYEEARPVLEERGEITPLVENLSGTAGLYHSMDRPADAVRLYADAIDLCNQSDECRYVPLMLVEMASAQLTLGQPRECMNSLDEAEDYLASAPDPATATRLWQLRALASIEIGDRDAAREQMVHALALARESGNLHIECDGLIMLSALYLALGAPDRAQDSAGKALDMARELEDPALERAAITALGREALARSDGPGALQHYSDALAIDEERAARAQIAQDLVGRGGAYSLLERNDEARQDLHRAATLFSEAGRESSQWAAWLNLADSFEESNPDSAAFYYDAALTALERGSDAAGGEAMNTGYLFAQRGHAYEEITRYYGLRHIQDPLAGWDAKAFETAERARARGLLELFEHSFARDAGPEALALIDSLYRIDTSTTDGRARRNQIQSELADLRAARQDSTSSLGLEPVGLARLFKEKPGQTLILQYAVGDSASWMWVIDRKATELHKLPGRAELERRVRSFRDAIAQPGEADQVLREEGHALYNILLSAVENRIARRRHVVIVPDDVLFELPFEALLAEESTGDAPWSKLAFVGRDVALTYAPSSTVYLDLRYRDGGKYDRRLLALGDADYSRLATPLEPLPFTRAEVEGISKKVKHDEQIVLLGTDATERDFKTMLRFSTPRVVHLATHGLIDPAEPLRSCVALGAGGDEDGYLYSLEILSLQLDQPMIVLSACESALGRLERGEGVVGLTRSFLAAGSQGVIASLWPVSDASTAALMMEFYEKLWGRTKASVAMWQARRAMLKSDEWSHPYFWAAFVLIGSEKMPW